MAQNKTENTPKAAPKSKRIEYREAVKTSKSLIQSGLGEKFEDHKSGRHFNMSMGVTLIRSKPDKLLAWAKADPAGFEALRLGVAHALEHGEDFAPEIHDWLVQFLRGEADRPKASAGRHGNHWLHQLIMMVVYALVSQGMTATRNDASEPTSACDAMADALSELGMEPATFHGVKRVWLNMEKRVTWSNGSRRN
ncbi:hypothetical protein ABIE58_000037 [Roseovarius sp. MBR-78]|jgi:hypothetical protein|uniref:hypothetical protein n=1 Tax=Roseovarius sp. MBR-78 TaxID=3156460 RepID=UPI003397726E